MPRALKPKEARYKAQLMPPKMARMFFKRNHHGRLDYVPSMYKIAYGGRGSAKSWGFAGAAVALGAQRPLRVLCVRELQNSIKESVHRLLTTRIGALGLDDYYTVQRDSIFGNQAFRVQNPLSGEWQWKRTEFIFMGIKTDPRKIKSLEEVDICFVEEAETVSEESWEILEPTVFRKATTEMWICFNPRERTDATYQRFHEKLPGLPRARWIEMNWSDNPWFPEPLEIKRQYSFNQIQLATDDDERQAAQDSYDHIWEGQLQKNSAAAIFRRRVVIDEFGEPDEQLHIRIMYGADFGFANDPSTLLRFWITDHQRVMSDGQVHDYQELWISHEAFGYRVEIDETPAMYDLVPGSRSWPIKGDCARPEVISYLARKGFAITAAEKWPGSVEDGIAHLKAFEKIHIHVRCKETQEEARLYSYKTDRITGEVLPIVLDKYNHAWDAIRYGMDGYIQRRGVGAEWARLAR